jgi:hypothetical protein
MTQNPGRDHAWLSRHVDGAGERVLAAPQARAMATEPAPTTVPSPVPAASGQPGVSRYAQIARFL